MKKLFVFMLLPILFVACNKMDDNGDFGGMWQMTEWKQLSDGKIVADKYNGIYWSVQLDLMKFGLGHSTGFYLARFKRTADSLLIGTVYLPPKDDIVGYDAVASYGVPDDGKFAIEKLSKQTLVLRSKEAVLTFRKY